MNSNKYKSSSDSNGTITINHKSFNSIKKIQSDGQIFNDPKGTIENETQDGINQTISYDCLHYTFTFPCQYKLVKLHSNPSPNL